MTKQQKEDVTGYIQRMIPDVARKCGVKSDEVILVMSELILTSSNDFTIVTWPEVQELMDLEGFNENSSLANSEFDLEKYGSQAYYVNKSWLINHKPDCYVHS